MLLLVSCSKDEVETTGNLMGVVRDARTFEPLSGVNVTINPGGKSVATGTDGRYEFTDILAQSYTVLAMKSDYQSEQKSSVMVNAGKDTQCDILLTPSTANLVVSQSTFDFGTDQTLSLVISNDGFAVLDWHISEDIPWLSFDNTSGKVQAGERASVVMNVDRSGLNQGEYTATFAVSSNGGSQVIRVNMSVRGVSISIIPDVLDFEQRKTILPISLNNNSTSTVPYTLSTSSNWIKLDKESGVLPPSVSEQLQVSVDRTGLAEGDYQGSIRIVAGGSQKDIPVKMNIPSKAKPIVVIGSASPGYNDAVLSGSIISLGSSNVKRYGFCWSKEQDLSLEKSISCTFAPTDTLVEFSKKILDLEQSTVYYYCAYAENDEGVAYSESAWFVTAGMPSAPEVVTGEVSNISATQAEVGGEIRSLGNVECVTEYGHVWSTHSTPTIKDSKIPHVATWSTGQFTSTLTGLHPNVTYYVRAYATNKIDTSYGEIKTFTTDYGVVTLVTNSNVDIYSDKATISVKITDNGGHEIVERGVCWSTKSQPSISDNCSPVATYNDSYAATITGLSAETEYFVRSYAKTARSDIYYGNQISFTTPEREVGIKVDGFDEEQFWNK